MAEAHAHESNSAVASGLLLFGWQNFLSADLIDEVSAFQVAQVRALFVVGEVRPYPLGHRQHETAIVHIQPLVAANELVVGVAGKRAVGFAAEVRLMKARHVSPGLRRGRRGFDVSFPEIFGLFAKTRQLPTQELHLNADDVLDVLGVG
jgi:hypothetical protein